MTPEKETFMARLMRAVDFISEINPQMLEADVKSLALEIVAPVEDPDGDDPTENTGDNRANWDNLF